MDSDKGAKDKAQKVEAQHFLWLDRYSNEHKEPTYIGSVTTVLALGFLLAYVIRSISTMTFTDFTMTKTEVLWTSMVPPAGSMAGRWTPMRLKCLSSQGCQLIHVYGTTKSPLSQKCAAHKKACCQSLRHAEEISVGVCYSDSPWDGLEIRHNNTGIIAGVGVQSNAMMGNMPMLFFSDIIDSLRTSLGLVHTMNHTASGTIGEERFEYFPTQLALQPVFQVASRPNAAAGDASVQQCPVNGALSNTSFSTPCMQEAARRSLIQLNAQFIRHIVKAQPWFLRMWGQIGGCWGMLVELFGIALAFFELVTHCVGKSVPQPQVLRVEPQDKLSSQEVSIELSRSL